jgi:hypothetical protein
LTVGAPGPHVAVTIVKAPPKWADLARDSGSNQYFTGCFTLRAHRPARLCSMIVRHEITMYERIDAVDIPGV